MNKIKFVHISDTHIGLNRFGKTNELGCNSRGEDFLKSFKDEIDKVNKLNPDFILHSGDLFDSVVVADRYIFETQKILQSIKCPVVIIAGNHSTPKSSSAISPVLLLSPIKNITVVVNSYKRIKLLNNTVCIHAIPHILDHEDFRKTLSDVHIDRNFKFNIAMTHGALPFGAYVCMEEGHMIPQSFIDREFNYIALGDYHMVKKIHNRCYYPGGSDIFKMSEMGEKVFLEVDLDEGISIKKHSIDTRNCLKISVECKGESLENVYCLIEKEISKENIKDALIFLELLNIDSSVYKNLDKVHVKNLFKGCFYMQEKIIVDKLTVDDDCSKNDAIGDIKTEWVDFSSKDKDVMEIGKAYIDSHMEESL